MQLHYGDEVSTIEPTPMIKARHLERPRILKVKLPRRVRPIDKIMRRERIHARMLKGAA